MRQAYVDGRIPSRVPIKREYLTQPVCHPVRPVARRRGAGRPAGRPRARRTACASRGDPSQPEGDGDSPPPPGLSQLVILSVVWALTAGMSGPERLAAFERLPRWLQDRAYSELAIRSRGGWR